jgi:histidinol-phosphatase
LDLTLALDVARRAVEAAGEAALRHFRGELRLSLKADGSPVTQADLEAERAILREIRSAFPSHAILAEESGASDGDPASRWIVDPLDGTRGFARGGSCWGPLVALELRGEIVAGAAALPALGEIYWAARGHGSFRNGARIRVSEIRRMSDATLCLGEMKPLLAAPHGPGVRSLVESAAVTRCPGDVAGCAMLLSGRADVWLEAGVRPWDLAPAKILVEEAGGAFTDFGGARSISRGEAAATNGALHAEVLGALAGRAPYS